METKGRVPNDFDNIEFEIVKEMMDALNIDDSHPAAQTIKMCAHAARLAVEKYSTLNK